MITITAEPTLRAMMKLPLPTGMREDGEEEYSKWEIQLTWEDPKSILTVKADSILDLFWYVSNDQWYFVGNCKQKRGIQFTW